MNSVLKLLIKLVGFITILITLNLIDKLAYLEKS